jgi:hypothetical protein
MRTRDLMYFNVQINFGGTTTLFFVAIFFRIATFLGIRLDQKVTARMYIISKKLMEEPITYFFDTTRPA